MKESAVPDMYEKIQDESTFLGKIASKIPGFSGYMEKSRRREADEILRRTISDRLEATRLELSSVHQELSGDIILAIEHAEPLGRVDNRLMGLIGKIKDAPQGYAGLFDAVKVKEDDLARIYEFDNQMLLYADQIATGAAALQKAVYDGGNIKQAIRELDRTVQEANNTFGSRQEILSGVA
ncbi:MAG: hypothetical protein KJ063_04750 [Anaerolineae bacterium]|nr:hypothetical protein [Anaerolineae bacterium]